MPALVKIANVDNTDYYDFTDSSNKILLINQSFTDSTTVEGEPVSLSFKTVAKGTAAEIRTDIEKIERLLHRANKWKKDETEGESFWIHAGSDGETGRRALIMAWSRTDTVQGVSDPLLNNSVMLISEWNFTRGPYWEAIHTAVHNVPNTFLDKLTVSPSHSGTPTAAKDGHQVFASTTHNELGTAPGRIKNIRITTPNTTAGGNYYERLWFGLKSHKGTINESQYSPCIKFDTTWGTPVDLDTWTDSVADTDAVDDECAEIQFSGGIDFKNRVCASLSGSSGDDEHLRGTYLVLARMRLTAGSTVCRTAMLQTWDYNTEGNWYGTSGLRVGDVFHDVFLESQKFHLYEMGVIQLPPEAYRNARRENETQLFQLHLGLAAERLTGSGSIRLDYFALIPQEFSFTLSNHQNGGTARYCDLTTDELMNQIAITTKFTPSWGKYINELSVNNLVWPTVPGEELLAVSAADIEIDDSDSEHHPIVSADSGPPIEFEFDIIPRYYSYNAD